MAITRTGSKGSTGWLKPGRLLASKGYGSSERHVSAARRHFRRRLVTALDLGTTKVCAIIAEIDEEGMISVLGVGSAPSRGIQRGEVKNISQTVEALKQAYGRAYDLAHVHPGEVIVGIAGDHISGFSNGGVVPVGNPNVGIDRRDIMKVREKALALTIPEDMEVIHKSVQEYLVDGTGGVTDPLGMFGRNLEIRMHVVTAGIAPASNIFKCVKLAGLKSSGIALQSLASSLAVLTPKEREMGVVLVDIGGGTTDVAIFQNGTLQGIQEIAMGGDTISSDISKILRISVHDADNLKKRLGHAVPHHVDADEKTDLPLAAQGAQRQQVERRFLAKIIEARVEEILTYVQKYVKRTGLEEKILAGLVLTGGTSLLEGIDEVAARYLNYPCRLGRPEGIMGMSSTVSTPIYSTAIGLIRYAADEDSGYQRERWIMRKFRAMFDLFV